MTDYKCNHCNKTYKSKRTFDRYMKNHILKEHPNTPQKNVEVSDIKVNEVNNYVTAEEVSSSPDNTIYNHVVFKRNLINNKKNKIVSKPNIETMTEEKDMGLVILEEEKELKKEINILNYEFSDSDSDDMCESVPDVIRRNYMGLQTITLLEKFDKHKLNYVLQNRGLFLPKLRITDDTYDPFLKPAEYLIKSEDGIFETSYRRTSYQGRGRMCARGSLSLQLFCREIRHTIASEFYDDLDMVNAHPVILKHLCDKHNIPTQYLDSYISDRNVVIDEVRVCNENLTTGDVKECILSMMNGGKKAYKNITNKTKWLIGFSAEISNIKTELECAYLNFFEGVKRYKGAECRDYRDSALNILLTDYEHNMLMHLCTWLNINGFLNDNAVLCFDGIMIPKSCDLRVGECSRYVSDKMGFDIQLKIKPMTDGFELPDKIHEFSETCGIDANDNYTWLDFDNAYRGRLFDSIDECINGVMYDLRRVHSIIEMGKRYIVKKTDCDKYLHDMVKYSEKHTDMYFRILGDKGKITELSYTKFLQYSANKQRRYQTIGFIPGNTDRRVYNLFTGYKAVKLDSYDIKKFKYVYRHLRDVVCNGCEKKFRYIMRYFAHILENPGIKSEVVLFLYSETQGTGKNSIFKFLSEHVIGKNYVREVQNIQPLVEKHNTVLLGKKVLVVDEARDTHGTFTANFDKLKSLITDDSFWIDPKGKDGFDQDNLLEIVMSSNHFNSVQIDQTDRRYFCLEVNDSKAGNAKYFKKLYSSFNDEAGNHFYTYALMEFGGKSRMDRPLMTPLKERMIEVSLPSHKRFIKCKPWLECDELMGDYILSTAQLYECYNNWCSDEGEKHPLKKKTFEMKLAPMLGKVKTMVHNRVRYNVELL